MLRLTILLLPLVMLAVLAVQNMATTVPVVILGQSIAEMSLGILLLVAIAIGAFLALILYGLVSLGRSSESKYRPMGRRVPYPESPSGTDSSSSGPSSGTYSGTDSSGSFADSSYGSRSSAFVSEPVDSSVSSSASAPASSPDPIERSVSTPPSESSSSASTSSASTKDSFGGSLRSTVSRSSDRSAFQGERSYSDPFISTEPSAEPKRESKREPKKESGKGFPKQPIAGLRSVFGKKKDRQEIPPVEPRADTRADTQADTRTEFGTEPGTIGDDWGNIRTASQRDDWDISEDNQSPVEKGARNLFRIGRDVSTQAGQIAGDIASGWGSEPTSNPNNNPGYDATAPANRDYSADPYYADDTYYTGNRSDGYDATSPDGLDQGWQEFDNYDDPPSPAAAKRTYGDSLYDDGLDGDDYDDRPSEIGPDGVYDADFRVITPPSKPLDSIDEEEA